MKVALVGGTGFIGSYIIDSLLDAGHQPLVLTRPNSRNPVPRADRVTTFSGDLQNRYALQSLMQDADALIYLVGILREFPSAGITFEAMQKTGFETCLNIAKGQGLKRIILMSANGVEADSQAYQSTKLAAEKMLQGSDCDWTVFRPGVVFGDPRGRMEFCSTLKQQLIDPPLPASVFFEGLQIHKAGAQPMAPVYVKDVADAFVNALEVPETFGKIYPLVGPKTLFWKDILKTIARATGKSGKLLMPVPTWGIKAVASVFERFAWFPLTRDQVTMLMQGNTGDSTQAFKLLGIEATAFSEKSLGYLKP